MTSAISPSTAQPTKSSSPVALPVRHNSPKPAVQAQQKTSYAHATRPQSTTAPSTAAIANPSSTTGPQAPVQHGKLDNQSSSKSMSAHANQAGLANGTPSADFPRTDSHARKQSAVISAQGVSGQIPNGGPVTNNTRPNIAFGSLNNGPQSNSAQSQGGSQSQQHSSLPAPKQDPRITSPAHSPSPIPQPPASGGKPPAALTGQGNGLVFGSSGAENGDSRNAPTPLTGAQTAHLRRDSSRSAHSDMSAAHSERGFMPPAGRGRPFAPPYGNSGSPAPGFRQMPNQRGPPNMQNQFQGQGNPGYRGRGSPATMNAQPHMAQNGHQQMPYNYQQHLNPQQYNGMYGMPPYDPSTGGYYAPFYPQHGYQGGPASPQPRQPYPSSYGGPPPSMPSPYHPPPSMSRSTSQISERPASSIGSRPPTTSTQQPTTPGAGSQASAPSSANFQIPARTKSKAIVIKNAAGEEVTFPKKAASPAPPAVPAPPKSPAVVATPSQTPPPRTPSTNPVHVRTDSRSLKSSDEVKNDFQEQVRRKAEEDRKKAQGDEPAAATDKEAEAKPATDKPAEKEAKAEAPSSAPTTSSYAPAAAATADKSAKEPTSEESAEDKAARIKREEDERLEREIAEMEAEEEAREREEQERERVYQEKKKKAAEEKAKVEAEKAAKADDEMKRLEREAEELELKREKERANPGEESEEAKANREMFASLGKSSLGPQADAAEASATPELDETPPTPDPSAKAAGSKSKPAQLKLETNKPVEPAQPTPGMQALKSARILDLQKDTVAYPDGIQSPNPALNVTSRRAAQYDRSFLLQFQSVFKEKPTVDWDQKVKETLGDGEPGSARPSASRQSSVSLGGRQASQRGPNSAGGFGGAMGSFGGSGRTLPAGTTSQVRFEASSQGSLRPGGPGQMGGFGRPGGAFPMGQSGSRQGSLVGNNPPSPRPGASRGKGSRRGPDRAMSRKEEEQLAKTMPLTAGMELKTLEKSATGWTARSIAGGPQPGSTGPDGMMAPDAVQRKVKAALNKMTPEKFDKISDQIMEISSQSKNESDGRTLRQVIQLTFEKACDEAHWAGMYAKFCQKMLLQMSNEIVDETITKNGQPIVGGNLFRKYLLNRCQEEFERGWEANLPEKPEGETEEAALLSDAYYIAAAAKRRGLGLIQFIGELYKLGMLTYRIMHQCVLRLLDFEGQPDESNVENLCRLLRTVGATMDNSDEQGHALVNAYFERITSILDTHKDMPSRPRFMLMDILDLRRNKWQDSKGNKGPKTIQEIHAEAEAAAAAAELERQKTNQRGGGRPPIGRGDARGFGHQGMPPPDYPRNQLGMDDLRKLQNRSGANRTASSGLGPSLGPGSSLYAGRTGSGRKGFGTPKEGDASGATSRTNSAPLKKEDKEQSAQANSFSALAALDAEGGDAARSPPSEKVSPAVSKATPSIDAASSDAPNGV